MLFVKKKGNMPKHTLNGNKLFYKKFNQVLNKKIQNLELKC